VQFRSCLLHQFRSAAEIGIGPGQHDQAVALAAADDGARRQHFARRLFHILRFAGQGRLVDAQDTGEEFYIRWDYVAGAHAHDIARDQLPGRDDLPDRIAPHTGADLQAAPQRFDDASGAALLRETQNGIDDQERAHHREIGIFSEHQ
jgi:hypothetical protein